MDTLPSFTAAQIALGLGSSRQAVQRKLDAVPAHGTRLVRGNEADVWVTASLPGTMLAKLSRRAKAKGYRNAEHMLSDPPRRFEAPVPINQLAAQVQQRCLKLRDALARPLVEHSNGLKGAALDVLGVSEYERIMGHVITPRRWRDVLNRTVVRDNGEQQWQRLDLYLDARPHVASVPKVIKSTKGLHEAETILLGYASQIRKPSQPTQEEKAMIWNTAFDQTIGLVEDGMKLSAARRTMRRVLWKCGITLAKNEISLAQSWRVKEGAWRNGDGHITALKDARSHSSGNFRTPEIPSKDIDLVIARAVRFGGRVSQAWRYVIENRMLSSTVQSYYEGVFAASKSYVPKAIRDAVTAETRLLRDYHHGPRTAKLNGAHITRDWSNVPAGDWYQADDVTMPIYYIAPDESGNLTLMRGQVLLMIDLRSTNILSFAFLDQRNYTAHSIRTLITKTCDAHGVSRKGFYFEGAIWKNSKLLKGDSKVSDNELSWTESEGGLRELGLKFRHSRLPRSKPVERVIGLIQNLLDGEPGDAGRDEVKDKFERLLQRKRMVESGLVPANQYFYTYDQWTEKLEQFCQEYNNSRNDGDMTGGLTPAQAWKEYQADPLVKLPPVARYLLSHHKRPVKVNANGITLRFGKQTFVYRNKETGRLIGRQVLAWFNPEMPDLLAVTDMNRENCFTVQRSEKVPAMDASEEVLNREMESIAEHNGYARQRYRVLAPLADLNARPTMVDNNTAKLGRDIEAQKIEGLAKQEKSVIRMKQGVKAFSRLGYQPRTDETITDRMTAAADKVANLLEDD